MSVSFGSEDDLTPDQLAVQEVADAIYDINAVGGCLHIVLDDYNFEDDSIDYCERFCGSEDDWACKQDPELRPLVAECVRLLRKLTYRQRVQCLCMHAEHAKDLLERYESEKEKP